MRTLWSFVLSIGVVLVALAATAGAPHARIVRVSDTASRALPGDCTFASRVQGAIEVVQVAGATADNAVQYRPALTVLARAHCPNGDTRAEVRLEGAQYSADQLEAALDARTRLTLQRGGRSCSVEPSFAFDGSAIRLADVADHCTPARGGGPQSTFLGGRIGRDVIERTDTLQGQRTIVPRPRTRRVDGTEGMGADLPGEP